HDFDVPQDVISIMLRTPPNELHIFTPEEIERLAINKAQPKITASAVDPSATAGTQSLLLEASDSGATGAIPFSGTVQWNKGIDELGEPDLVARASIPARGIIVELVIRKNSDPAWQAT